MCKKEFENILKLLDEEEYKLLKIKLRTYFRLFKNNVSGNGNNNARLKTFLEDTKEIMTQIKRQKKEINELMRLV